ncbi:MAG: sulfotransferase [Gammaproteobacteria bacterium]|nr:sulfotransferase [Gammaproteobacteria bacterium]
MREARPQAPPCVIVLGMHRSGTSLLTGSLEAAGLNLGNVNNAAKFNEKGNKENESIRDLNDALLAKADAAWNLPPEGQVRWDRADEGRGRVLIGSYLDAARPWGFKDPRTIWTVEGWLRLLPDACMVGVFRHPSLVVRSLTARSGTLAIEADEALRLWCAYNAELIRLERKYGFPVLHFGAVETFRDDVVAPLTAFARAIGLTGALDRFFDRRLVHQAAPEPAPTIESRHLFGQLIEMSRQALPARSFGPVGGFRYNAGPHSEVGA